MRVLRCYGKILMTLLCIGITYIALSSEIHDFDRNEINTDGVWGMISNCITHFMGGTAAAIITCFWLWYTFSSVRRQRS